ncbi:MAG: ATP-dependent RecD-like DNA helicase [Desulfobacterales bacterium]|nr:ATP-dependent RecD-like DNA helicase [Desulfobacterales bacterium]
MPPVTTANTLLGHIERVTFHNRDNHYTIARFRVDKTDGLVTILGTMPNPSPGETLTVTGRWETHPRYGPQLRIKTYEALLPDSKDELAKYLASGLISGLGRQTAKRLVAHFGKHTIDVIENDSERLKEVAGVGEVLAFKIAAQWKAKHALRSLMAFLQENGIKTAYCQRIVKTYGDDAEKILKNEPYRLVHDIPGIGFHIADTIAINAGASREDPLRIRECLLHLLLQAADTGHTFCLADDLKRQCFESFEINPELAEDALAELAAEQEVVIERSTAPAAVYHYSLYEAENGIAAKIHALMSVPLATVPLKAEQITAQVLKKLALKLSPEQLQVVAGILAHRVGVITGGPGTGKTTLVRSLCAVFGNLGKTVSLAAPTGRAARRLSEVTGKKAATIHKLLGYNPTEGFFERDRDNPLDTEVMIVDEVSMVDTLLMYQLTRALPATVVLILVGDAFQLPSVGPGNVLADIIDSAAVPVFSLNTIFRQAAESPIVLNAHKVRSGAFPEIVQQEINQGLSEFTFIETQQPNDVVSRICQLCTQTLPEKFGLDCVQDIQVLTPMHRGEAGTINLNQVLQQKLNARPAEEKIAGVGFRPGDKVMHLRNNYQKDVFNGDIGTVKTIDPKEKTLRVTYYDRDVNYDFAELDELILAYAISVHKSQGSEYPAVIVPLLTQHYILLQRNLLYTAMTRGKKLVILIGSPRALEIAVQNDQSGSRRSGLEERLKATAYQ